jgi:hypothetical protein
MNEITVSTGLSFNRVAKSGKVTTRGTLGVLMSGNRSESSALSRIAAKALIANNTFAPVMAEICRVFPASALTKFGVFKVGDAFAMYDPATKTITPLEGGWNTASADAYCKCVIARCEALEAAGKEVKGEKVLAALFAEELVRHVKDKAEAKALANA